MNRLRIRRRDVADLTRTFQRNARLAPADLALLDAFVTSQQAALAKQDLVYITAFDGQTAFSLNLIDPTRFTLYPVGNPVREPGLGVRAASQNDLWGTGFVPSRDSVKATLNDAEEGIFVLTNDFLQGNGSPLECGMPETLIKALEVNVLTGTPGTIGGRINRVATIRSAGGVRTTAVGLTSLSRQGLNISRIYRNGEYLGGGGGASQSLGNTEIALGGAFNNMGWSNRRFGFFHFGASLTDAERLSWYEAVATLLAGLGAYNPADAEGPPYEPLPPDPYAPSADKVWTDAFVGTPLDLTGYSLTFEDDFNDTSGITIDGGAGPWRAPVHARVGAAEFGLPTDDPSPFSVTDGVLDLKIQQTAGVWSAAHMQTISSAGVGFSQALGYFEVRMNIPPGQLGCWAAFWLYSADLYRDPTVTKAEIDVLEYYPGQNANGHHAALHLRPAATYQVGQVSQHWYKSVYTRRLDLGAGGWHTHGVMLTPEWIIIYMDGLELNRFPMLPEFTVPMYILLSNQFLSAEQTVATSPIHTYVDYVRVYAKAP